MRKLYLLSGGYGAGKTRFSRRMASQHNTVALATDIRSDLFKIFKDERFHSIQQSDKDGLVAEADLLSVIKRHRYKDIPANIFKEFISVLGGLESLKTLTIRDVMKIYGACGRKLNKFYWVNRTIKRLKELSGDIAIDDLRFSNELLQLRKFASKNNIEIIHFFMGPCDDEYNNRELFEEAHYYISWNPPEGCVCK